MQSMHLEHLIPNGVCCIKAPASGRVLVPCFYGQEAEKAFSDPKTKVSWSKIRLLSPASNP